MHSKFLCHWEINDENKLVPLIDATFSALFYLFMFLSLDRNLFSFVILWIKEKCYWCRQKVKNSVCLFAIFLIIPFPVLHLLWKSWWQSSLFKTRSKVTSWDLREFHKFFFNMQTWWPFTRNVSYFLWNIFTWLLFFVTPSRITFR